MMLIVERMPVKREGRVVEGQEWHQCICSEFSRERESIGCVYKYRMGFIRGLASMIMVMEKSHDRLSTS
jgi:hypothetical protein